MTNEPLASALAEAVARCIEIAREVRDGFLSEEYAVGQPIASMQERFACDQVASAIRDEFDISAIDQGPQGEERFLSTIKDRTPNGEWIAVKCHPNGDWSVVRAALAALQLNIPSQRCREAAAHQGQPASKEMIVEEKKTETTTTTTTDPKPAPEKNPAPAPSQEPSRPTNPPAR